MSKPLHTRLRFIRAKKPQDLSKALEVLRRIQIYGAPVWDGKHWYLWFVPGDQDPDVKNIEI